METVYVFDVDGVLCEIGSPTLEPRVIRLIAQLLEKKIFVAINTGRGYDRVGPEFVEPLARMLSDVSLLDRLFVSTEMGGEATTYKNGEAVSERTAYSLTSPQLRLFKDSWQKHEEQFDAMHLYDTKQSMGTVVRLRGSDEQRYVNQKAAFEAALHAAFSGEDVIITGTVESTDVHAKNAGKNAGAMNIIEWLEGRSDITHDAAVCFGDSHNDYEMARVFADKGFVTTFVYTGLGLEVAELHDGVRVVDTEKPFTGGTIEYLKAVLGS